jgi:hypothetical protein
MVQNWIKGLSRKDLFQKGRDPSKNEKRKRGVWLLVSQVHDGTPL